MKRKKDQRTKLEHHSCELKMNPIQTFEWLTWPRSLQIKYIKIIRVFVLGYWCVNLNSPSYHSIIFYSICQTWQFLCIDTWRKYASLLSNCDWLWRLYSFTFPDSSFSKYTHVRSYDRFLARIARNTEAGLNNTRRRSYVEPEKVKWQICNQLNKFDNAVLPVSNWKPKCVGLNVKIISLWVVLIKLYYCLSSFSFNQHILWFALNNLCT